MFWDDNRLLDNTYVVLFLFAELGEVGKHLLGQCVGFGSGMGLAIDADDRLGVALAEMSPAVGEIDLHTVDGAYTLVLVFLLHLAEDAVNVHSCNKVLAVLGDDILGIGLAELREGEASFFFAFLCQHGKEEGHAYESIATGMEFGVNHTSVAFATDYGADFAHLGYYVNLANSSGSIGEAAFLGDVAESTGGAHVAHSIAGGVVEHIVGNAHERIFFAKHLAVLADESQTVNIRVDNDTHVAFLGGDEGCDVGKVLGDGLGIVLEVAGRVAVQLYNFVHAESLEQAGDGDSAGGVDGIYGYAEVGFLDGFSINQFELEHALDMGVDGVVVFGDFAKVVDFCETDFVALCQSEHLVAFGCVDELALLVEELECVPMAGVVAGCDDDAAIGLVLYYRHFGGRGGGEACFDNIDAHALKGSYYKTVDHGAGKTGVASYYEGESLPVVLALEEGGECGGELDNVDGAESIACGTADGAADTRYGFD